MRLLLLLVCVLSACGPSGQIFGSGGEGVDAGAFDATFSSDAFTPPPPPQSKDAAIDTGPGYIGGPLACGTCTCDGTLYTCLEEALGPDGGCPHGGGPPPPPSPILGDASDDADVDSSCGAGNFCMQIPIACLPKPTCACITQETHLPCKVDPSGSGFVLVCPIEP